MKHIETLIGTNKIMKTKPLTLLLALTFLLLFSCSEEKPKTQYIENPKVTESFEKYLLPIIKSFPAPPIATSS